MPEPTVNQIYADARVRLGDEACELFTDEVLLPFAGTAYREVDALLAAHELPASRREAYLVVPAYTNILYPSAYGITDMSEPLRIEERGNLRTLGVLAITNVTPPIVQTSTDHGLVSNAEVSLYNVNSSSSLNGRFFVTVVDTTHFGLNGAIAAGLFSSGSTVVVSSDRWSNTNKYDILPLNDIPNTKIRSWAWDGTALLFTPATEQRQIRLIYTATGDFPSSGTVPINNSRNHLAVRTASLAAAAYDKHTLAADLTRQALGPSGEPDGSGGTLRLLINPMLLNKPPVSVSPFRHRRNRNFRFF